MTGAPTPPEGGPPVIVGTHRRYMPLLKLTLWSAGLLVALMFGMLSAYLVTSAVWFGSRFARALRERATEVGGRFS